MSGLPEFRSVVGEVSARLRDMRSSNPDLMAAFGQLSAAGTSNGALDRKTRELIGLGIAIACRCDDCIGFHVEALVKLGLTRAELDSVIGTAVYMGGGPSLMYAAHVLKAFEDFQSAPG